MTENTSRPSAAETKRRNREFARARRVRAEPSTPSGMRLAARFAEHGLDEALPDLRGQPARPASLDDD